MGSCGHGVNDISIWFIFFVVGFDDCLVPMLVLSGTKGMLGF